MAVAAILAGPCSWAPLSAQDSMAALVVRVRAADTGAPVAGAAASFTAVHLSEITDERGLANFGAVPAGSDLIRVRAYGYRPVAASLNLVAAETTAVIVTLRRLPIQLPTVKVTGRTNADLARHGFYKRQRGGFGTFFTHQQIEDAKPVRTRDLLNLAAGVRASDRGISVPSAAGCSGVNEFVDGVHVVDHKDEDFVTTHSLAIDRVPIDRIAGMEVYVVPTIPPPYGLGSPCAVVLVWLMHSADGS